MKLSGNMVCLYNTVLLKLLRKYEIIKSADEWIKPETIISSEVTQTQKANVPCFLSSGDANCESSAMCVSFGIPTKVRKILKARIEDIKRTRARK